MKRNNKPAIITAIIGFLSLIGLSGYLISKEFSYIEQNQNVKLDNRLLIGTYKETKSSNPNALTSYNRLYVEIYNNGEVVYKSKYSTSEKIFTSDSSYSGVVYLDLTEEMSKYISNLGIYYWSLSNPNKNYVSVRTEVINSGYISGDIRISDSGMYLVNVPTKNDVIPQVEHCYIYQKNEVKW